MIYDVFNFFNELELLEIRLHELDDFVDQFVLVEATKTFQNNPKELVYDKNKSLFSRWHHKLTHVIVNDSPDTDDTWAIETFQFNAASRGMPNLQPEDTIMWCCTDEIPNKLSIKEAMKDQSAPAMMMQHQCGAYLNCWFKDKGFWTGSRLISGKQWMDSKDQYESFRKHWLGRQVLNGGWHFCNMGGPERFRLKMQSFSHKEYNAEGFTNLEVLSKKLKACYDLYDPESGETMYKMPFEMLPQHIANNQKEFASLLIP